MVKDYRVNIVENLEEIYAELAVLESLLTILKDNYIFKELNSVYYNSEFDKILLSKERNNCINMLNLTLNRIDNLGTITNNLELAIYNNTPTIAADK